ENPVKIFDLVLTRTKGFKDKDWDKYTEEELIYIALTFMDGLTKRKFAQEDFNLLWQNNYATLNFKLADTAIKTEDKLKYYGKILKQIQKIKLDDLVITGSVRPSLIYDQATLLEVILYMKLAGVANDIDQKMALQGFTRSLITGEQTLYADSDLSAPKNALVWIFPSKKFNTHFGKTNICLNNNSSQHTVVLRATSPLNLVFTVEREKLPDRLGPAIPYLEGIFPKVNYTNSYYTNFAVEKAGEFAHTASFNLIVAPDLEIAQIDIFKKEYSVVKKVVQGIRRNGIFNTEIKITFKNGETKDIVIKDDRINGQESHALLIKNEKEVLVDWEIEKQILKENVPEDKELGQEAKEDPNQLLAHLIAFKASDAYRLGRGSDLDLSKANEKQTDTARIYMDNHGTYGRWIELISELPLWTEVKDLVAASETRLDIFYKVKNFLEKATRRAPEDKFIRMQLAKIYSLIAILEKSDMYDINKAKIYAEAAIKIYEEELIKPLEQKAPSERKIKYLWELKHTIDYAQVLNAAPTISKDLDYKRITRAMDLLEKAAVYFLEKTNADGFIYDTEVRAQLLRWIEAYANTAENYLGVRRGSAEAKQYLREALVLLEVVVGNREIKSHGYKLPGKIASLFDEKTKKGQVNRVYLIAYDTIQKAYYRRDLAEFRTLYANLMSKAIANGVR
ncbi:MAG: hypothetical protein KKA19_01485, partial [Candidatus Margulisbacteria bacterium]|nr:hypothetical protein [Candidatus Margulisiibacteriota bacterium]